MEKRTFVNSSKDAVYYLKWEVANPKANVVISHGMVEHPSRYEPLAKYLNNNDINVYAIYHIGHGEDAKVLNHMGKHDFDKCVSNLNELINLVKGNGEKTFLLGHSMGSFISQLYITRFNNIDGLILSGSTKSNFISKTGAFVASIITAFSKDKTKPSYFLNKMAFGSYNNAFKPSRTDFDWLTRNEKIVDEYIASPYCGGICSASFYYNLTSGMAKMGKKKYLKNINLDLPIYIHGGAKDPVSNFSKGLFALASQYMKLGVKSLKIDVYDDDRHEIYNELNYNEVFENTLNFINSNL